MLTEEELNKIEKDFTLLYLREKIANHYFEKIKSLIASNLSTLSANAELSFKLKDFEMWKAMTLQFTTEEEARRIYRIIKGEFQR